MIRPVDKREPLKPPGSRIVATAETWFDYAQAAMRHLEASGGASEAAYRSFAVKVGGKMQVVQRLVRAARFVCDVEIGDRDLGRDLQRAPIDSVLVLASWARRDRVGALAAARRVADGDIGLSGLRELERQGRASGQPVLGAPMSDSEWQIAVAGAVEIMIVERHPGAVAIWSAKGWRAGPRTRLRIPGPLAALQRTPLLHLAFDDKGEIVLVSISAARGDVARRTTLTTQTMIALMGYCALGYRAVYCTTNTDERATALEMLDELRAAGHAQAIGVELVQVPRHLAPS
jgi:hypothetical protein